MLTTEQFGQVELLHTVNGDMVEAGFFTGLLKLAYQKQMIYCVLLKII